MKAKKKIGLWYCKAGYFGKDKDGKSCIAYKPAKRDPNISIESYCKNLGEFFTSENACKRECQKLNKATKISSVVVANAEVYDKITIRELIGELLKNKNLDQEVVIYPKYTGSDADSISHYRFTIAKLEDQWHQNHPCIALMF